MSGGWLHLLATVTLGPLLLVQGRHVRGSIEKLPEPPGAREGRAGRGPHLRVLFVGDSSAVGVGVSTLDDALPGRVVAGLASDHETDWRLIGRTGATTRDTLARLSREAAGSFDIAVTALGVNDVTRGRSLDGWLEEQAALVTLLEERYAVRRTMLSGLPPVHRFPALPQPLRWYLGAQTRRFDRALARLAEGRRGCTHVPISDQTGDAGSDAMASDGFHPGPRIYARWAELVVEGIRRQETK
ncbi:hypothetical protein ABI59_11740 [Acidobacteria bacterium Mor1]|nr:hypothetical protein ABI59_11740 [Acidobacteria bacterium Mor1]